MSTRIDPNLRVLLIGGSSNVGKSAVAAALAEQLGWRCVSTDSLARHPGRPWRQSNKKVPSHVADHYLILKANELLESIILHHRKMSPIVAELVKATVNDTSLPKLVLEGSALWPFITSGPQQKEVASIWLTASADTLRSRIYENSGFANANEQNRAMISRFLERTLLFDRKTAELVNGHGCRVIDVDAYQSAEELREDIMEHLKTRRKP